MYGRRVVGGWGLAALLLLGARTDPASTAAVAAATVQKQASAVVDARLARKVSLALRATSLEDLCRRLREESGVHLVAGRSVADAKATLFCRETPLREVMRQLGRPFGYTWLRSGKAGEYRYELVQDLRSQLLEEELRSQDRNAALVALDDDMAQYREYLGLSPGELRERLAKAKPGEKERLERVVGHLWGPAQMYSRLSPQDMAALRAGKEVVFSAHPGPGEQQLPPEVVRGVLQAFPDWRARKQADGEFDLELEPGKLPDGLPLDQVPEANARVRFKITQNELGQLDLDGQSGVLLKGRTSLVSGEIASGVSPTVRNPRNAAANAKLKGEPALRAKVTIEPKASCGTKEGPPRVTSADVLEAIHRTTGRPVVADFYTRLHDPAGVTVRNTPLFDALNHVADAMRLRWQWERPDSADSGGGWLRFRSASYFNDRIKEVPNRLLNRWAASRREHGALTLDDLVEIAGLTDAQLDSGAMAEGAKHCFRLAEWDLARNNTGLRPQLRFLATLTKGQRDQARRPEGLSFRTLTLAQQQAFLSLLLERAGSVQRSFLEHVGSAVLQLDYETPGAYQWWVPRQVDAGRWIALVRSPVRASTREAALQAAQKVDPEMAEARIVPTKLRLMLAVTWTSPQAKEAPVFVLRASPTGTQIRATDGMGHVDNSGNGSGEVFEE
jgi:hypothetical protein